MNAALVFPVVAASSAPAPAPFSFSEERALAIPPELAALFTQSAKAKASFLCLEERDRRGFVGYIEEAKTPSARQRRAAIIAMSLIGLASKVAAAAE